MEIEHLSGSQLSPQEVQFIAEEFGCTPEQVRTGQLPTQPINHYTPQYNPYQQIPSYNYQQPYPQQQYYQPPMYNQYGQSYQPYPAGYTSMYQNYQAPPTIYPQYSYNQNGPVQDMYGQWYNSYTEMMLNQSKQQIQQDYRNHILEGNPFAQYIQLVADYQPVQNQNTTYYGYTPQYVQQNTYGFTMDEDDKAIFKTQDKYLENQKKVFESLSRGAMIASGKNVDGVDIQRYYKDQITPDISEIEKDNNPLNLPENVINLRSNGDKLGYYENMNKRMGIDQVYKRNNLVNAMNRQMEEVRKITPENMTLSEFLKIGGKLYGDALYEDHTKQYRRDMQNAYETAHYNAMVRPPLSDPNYYASMMRFGQTNVDDISISAPAFLKRNYEERRQRFIDYVKNGGSELPF